MSATLSCYECTGCGREWSGPRRGYYAGVCSSCARQLREAGILHPIRTIKLTEKTDRGPWHGKRYPLTVPLFPQRAAL